MAQNDAFVHFHGNLVRDPERKKVGENDVCSFTVAVKTDYKKNKNQEDFDSNFYDCSLWGTNAVNYFMDVCQKGTFVYVDGDFCQAEYTGSDNTIKHRMRVKVDNWKALLRTKPKPEGAQRQYQRKETAQPQVQAEPAAEGVLPF